MNNIKVINPAEYEDNLSLGSADYVAGKRLNSGNTNEGYQQGYIQAMNERNRQDAEDQIKNLLAKYNYTPMRDTILYNVDKYASEDRKTTIMIEYHREGGITLYSNRGFGMTFEDLEKFLAAT